MNHTELLQSVNDRLRDAIARRNPGDVDHLYDEASCTCYDGCDEAVIAEHLKLVEQGNEVITSLY